MATNQKTVPEPKIDTNEMRSWSASVAESEPTLITDGGETDDADTKKKSVLIELSEEQYTELKAIKKKNGFTWLGMLLHAQRCLYREERQ